MPNEIYTDEERKVREETEKAFGSCKKCYGKGYSTEYKVTSSRLGKNVSPDSINFCSCERGKQLEQVITKAKIEAAQFIKSQNVAIPCEPDCSGLRHAKHEGAWEQHLEFDEDIDRYIDELKQQLSK